MELCKSPPPAFPTSSESDDEDISGESDTESNESAYPPSPSELRSWTEGNHCVCFCEDWSCCDRPSFTFESGEFWRHARVCKRYEKEKHKWYFAPQYDPFDPEAYKQMYHRTYEPIKARPAKDCTGSEQSCKRLFLGYHECWFCHYDRELAKQKKKRHLEDAPEWKLYEVHVRAISRTMLHRKPMEFWIRGVDDGFIERHFWALRWLKLARVPHKLDVAKFVRMMVQGHEDEILKRREQAQLRWGPAMHPIYMKMTEHGPERITDPEEQETWAAILRSSEGFFNGTETKKT